MKESLVENVPNMQQQSSVETLGEFVSGTISRPPPPSAAMKQKPRAWLRVVGLLLMGATCGYFGMRFAVDLFEPIPGPKWLSLLCVGALPIIWLLAVGIHELGHIIGGWIGGGNFLLWMVGPFMVRRTPAGLRAGWNRSINLTGGLAVCVPLDPARVTPRRVAVMIAGGPAASLLLTTAALWLASWLTRWTDPVSTTLAVAQNIAIFTAGMSFLIFLVAIAPSAMGGFKSDGKRVLELLRGDHRSAQEAAMLVLTAAGLSGVRPANYDPTLVAKTASLADGSLFDFYGKLTVYYHAADRGDWLAAQAHLNYVAAGLEKIAPYAQDIVRCEYAWLIATQTRDAASARAWLASAGKLEFDLATRLRAEAAVLLAEGNKTAALEKAQAGLQALEQSSISPVKSLFATDALKAVLGLAQQESVS